MLIDMAVIVHDAGPDGTNHLIIYHCYKTTVIGKITKVTNGARKNINDYLCPEDIVTLFLQ